MGVRNSPGQQDNQPLTIELVSGFFILARFLLGFGGILGFFRGWRKLTRFLPRFCYDIQILFMNITILVNDKNLCSESQWKVQRCPC